MRGHRIGARAGANQGYRWLWPFLLLFLAACAVPTQSVSIPTGGAVRIESATARPAAIGQNGAAYFTIFNPTGEDDRLLAVETHVATVAELHQTQNDNGVMRMRHYAEGLLIPARSSVPFAPGGNHVMLIELNQPLTSGASFTLTLMFADAGAIDVAVSVQTQ